MASRFVRPETKRIPISNGDWIEVKKRLSAGENRAMLARVYTAGVTGDLKANPLETGLAEIVAYLLDWSLRDEQGQPVVIREKSPDELAAIVDGLDQESFAEIKDAIEAHEAAMQQEREQEKKPPSGDSASSATSLSPSAAGGDTSG